MIELIKLSGGIPFVRSNVPQLLLATFTQNYIYGTSYNPWDKKRTVGGSSGGEGGLVASRCSPIGLGSDIGGSIRYPACFTGTVGFKPGNHRITNIGSMVRSRSHKATSLLIA